MIEREVLEAHYGAWLFDLKGITVVKRPSLGCQDFVSALDRKKYVSLVSTCFEIRRDESIFKAVDLYDFDISRDRDSRSQSVLAEILSQI